MCVCVCVTRLIFEHTKALLDSQFSFSEIGCLTKSKVINSSIA